MCGIRLTKLLLILGIIAVSGWVTFYPIILQQRRATTTSVDQQCRANAVMLADRWAMDDGPWGQTRLSGSAVDTSTSECFALIVRTYSTEALDENLRAPEVRDEVIVEVASG